LFVIKNDKPKKKLKFFLFFLVLTLLPLSSAVTLNSGITLTTTSSNSSLTFLVPIEVTNLTITPHNITLEGIDCLGPYDEIYTTLFMNTEGLDSKKIMSMIITIIIVGLLLIVGILIVGSIGGC